MEISWVVIILLIGVAVSVVVARRRHDPAPDGGRPPGLESIEAAVPTFRIVALGLQGSGKTLLLASMFHQLQAPAGQRYYLTAGDDDLARLNRWFTTMADSSQPREWPRGTTASETRRFVFGVRTRDTGTVHEVMRLDYLEYAGELLTSVEEGSNRREELFAHLREANALIGIIDGQRIRQHLDGRPGAWIRLAETLNVLIPQMIGVTCPVSFVITKWDLLEHIGWDENDRLEIVRDMLMASDPFRALIEAHSRDRVVRLIPVSAVGPGFAQLDGRGMPVKNPAARARPTNVDVPLSAVVPDLFDQAERRLNGEFRQAIDAEVGKLSRKGPLEVLAAASALAGQSAGRALLQAFGVLPVIVLGDVLVGMFMDSRSNPVNARQDRIGRRLDEVEERVGDFLEARRRVLLDMRAKPERLEGRLPGSRLSGRWSR